MFSCFVFFQFQVLVPLLHILLLFHLFFPGLSLNLYVFIYYTILPPCHYSHGWNLVPSTRLVSDRNFQLTFISLFSSLSDVLFKNSLTLASTISEMFAHKLQKQSFIQIIDSSKYIEAYWLLICRIIRALYKSLMVIILGFTFLDPA